MKRLLIVALTLTIIALFISPTFQTALAQTTTTVVSTITDVNKDGLADAVFQATNNLGSVEGVQVQVSLGTSLVFTKTTDGSGQAIIYDPPSGAYSWKASNGQSGTFQISEHTYRIGSETEVLQWLMAVDFMNSPDKGRSLYQNIANVLGYNLLANPMPTIDGTNSANNTAISAVWINWINGLIEQVTTLSSTGVLTSDLSKSFIDILSATGDGLSAASSIDNPVPLTIEFGEIQDGLALNIDEIPAFQALESTSAQGGFALFGMAVGVLDILHLSQENASLETVNLDGVVLNVQQLGLYRDGLSLIAGLGTIVNSVVKTAGLQELGQAASIIFGTAVAALSTVITITGIYQELQADGLNGLSNPQLWIQVLSLVGNFAVMSAGLISILGWAGISSIGSVSLTTDLASTLFGIASGVGLIVVASSLILYLWTYFTDVGQVETEMSPLLTQLWQVRTALSEIDPNKMQAEATNSMDMSIAAGELTNQIAYSGSTDPQILSLKTQLGSAQTYWSNLAQAETSLSTDAANAVTSIDQLFASACYHQITEAGVQLNTVTASIAGILSVNATVEKIGLGGAPSESFNPIASYYQPSSTDPSQGSYYATSIESGDGKTPEISQGYIVGQSYISSQTNSLGIISPTGWAWDIPTQQDSNGKNLAVFYRPQSSFSPNNFLFDPDGSGNQYSDYYQYASPQTDANGNLQPYYLLKFSFENPYPAGLQQWSSDLFGTKGLFSSVQSSIQLAYNSLKNFEQVSVFENGVVSPTYDVTINQSGLAPGVSWSVTFESYILSSLGSSITFNVPDGVYSYSIGVPSGYALSSSEQAGSIIVSGAAISDYIQFSAVTPPQIWMSSSTDGLTVSIQGGVTPSNQLSYIQFNWGDGSSINSGFPCSHTFTQSGTYTITVTAYFTDGSTAASSTSVNVYAGTSQSFTLNFGGYGSGNVSYSYSSGSGTVSSSQSISLPVSSGMQISLTAIPNTGSCFDSWAIADGITILSGSATSSTIIIVIGDGGESVAANFDPLTPPIITINQLIVNGMSIFLNYTVKTTTPGVGIHEVFLPSWGDGGNEGGIAWLWNPPSTYTDAESHTYSQSGIFTISVGANDYNYEAASISENVEVIGPFTCSITTNPTSVVVAPGGNWGIFYLNASLDNGPTQPIILSISGLPQGVTWYNPTGPPTYPQANGISPPFYAKSYFFVLDSAPGIYPITITCTSNGLTFGSTSINLLIPPYGLTINEFSQGSVSYSNSYDDSSGTQLADQFPNTLTANSGTQIQLTAIAGASQIFEYWIPSGAISLSSTTSSSTLVTVAGDGSVTPMFAPETLNVGSAFASASPIDAGQKSVLSVSITGGSKSYTYQWMMEAPGSASFSNINGANSPTYTFAPSNSATLGNYQFEVLATDTVTTDAGTSSPVTITVDPALATPVVTASSVKLALTQTSVLTSSDITATGTSPFTYQWMEMAPGGSYVDVGSDSSSFSFVTIESTATGLWSFKLQVTDSAGAVTTSSAITVSVSSSLATVVRGCNNCIYYSTYNYTSTSWSVWNNLPTGTTIDSPATAIVSNILYVVVRGMDGSSLWFSSVNLTNNAFSGWSLLSGSTPSAPTLTSNGTTLALVVQGENNLIYYQFYTIASQTWSGWSALPSGTTVDSPAASLVGNTLYVVVTGSDGASLWFSNINPTTDVFSGWTPLDGSSPSAPTLTSNSTTLALVVQGENNLIYYQFYTIASQTWSGWTALPSGTTPDSPAATLMANTLCITVVGSDGSSLWQSSINLETSIFSGWMQLSGSTLSKPVLTS